MKQTHSASRARGAFFRLALPSPATAIISLCGALGLWLGMANSVLHLPPLALLYPAALLLLGQTAPDKTNALRRGWLCGLAGASACLYWIAVPVHDFGALPWVLAASCALVLGAYVGLYGGLFSLLAHTTRNWPFWQRAASWGVSWFLLEWVRGMLLTGFPWVPLAAAFAPWPSWIQGAAFVGAYGLGGVLAMLSCMVAEGTAAAIPGTTAPAPLAPRHHLLRVIMPLCAMGLLVAAGHWRVADMAASLPSLPTLRVALVQGNVDKNQTWSTQYQQQTVHLYAELSRQAPEAELLIWPETAMPFAYPEHALSTAVQAFTAQQKAWVLFGAPGVVRQGKEHALFNRAYLLRPDGQNSASYEKEHLVPFGEYMPPWLDIPFLRYLLQGVGNFTPGRQVTPLILHPQASTAPHTAASQPPLALGMLICYESFFPELSQARVADAATLLINISNDAWFGRTAAPEQHLHLSVLRAVEQGRTLVRGTNTGISAVVDPIGRIRARSELFVATVLEAEVPLRRDLTVLHRLFYFLAPAAGLVLCGLFVAARRRERRRPVE